MTDSSMIATYLTTLRQALRLSARRRERILLVEGHLRESAAQLEMESMTPEEAQSVAIARFGPAQLFAQQFAPWPIGQARSVSASGVAASGAGLTVLHGQERRVAATLSRVGIRPLGDEHGRWDLADPGYRAAALPVAVAFEIEAVVIGPDAGKDEPAVATAWMNDPQDLPLIVPQPMRWCWMSGTCGATRKRRHYLAVQREFVEPGIYTIAVQISGALPIERGLRVHLTG